MILATVFPGVLFVGGSERVSLAPGLSKVEGEVREEVQGGITFGGTTSTLSVRGYVRARDAGPSSVR